MAPVLAGNGGGAIVSIVFARSWAAGARRLRRAQGGEPGRSQSRCAPNSPGKEPRVADVHLGYTGSGITRGLNLIENGPADVARAVLDGVEDGRGEVFSAPIQAITTTSAYLTRYRPALAHWVFSRHCRGGRGLCDPEHGHSFRMVHRVV